jgi:hypothetical protein
MKVLPTHPLLLQLPLILRILLVLLILSPSQVDAKIKFPRSATASASSTEANPSVTYSSQVTYGSQPAMFGAKNKFGEEKYRYRRFYAPPRYNYKLCEPPDPDLFLNLTAYDPTVERWAIVARGRNIECKFYHQATNAIAYGRQAVCGPNATTPERGCFDTLIVYTDYENSWDLTFMVIDDSVEDPNTDDLVDLRILETTEGCGKAIMKLYNESVTLGEMPYLRYNLELAAFDQFTSNMIRWAAVLGIVCFFLYFSVRTDTKTREKLPLWCQAQASATHYKGAHATDAESGEGKTAKISDDIAEAGHVVIEMKSPVVEGDAGSVLDFQGSMKLSKQTSRMLAEIGELVSLRDTAQRIADAELPENIMNFDAFDSFGGSPKQDSTVPSLKVLLRKAAIAKATLDGALSSFLESQGIDPAEFPLVNGSPISFAVDGKPPYYANYTSAPLKTTASCERKVKDDYNGDFLKLCDVARCTVVVTEETSLANILLPLVRGDISGIKIVRLKNRFKHFLFTGIRDCLMNVEITCPDGTCHIGEVQLHFAPILALKGRCHKPYEYFREYFKGNSSSYEARVALFDGLKGAGQRDSGLKLVEDILLTGEVSQLKALEQIADHDMMGDYNLLVRARYRLLELANEGDGRKSDRETQVLEHRLAVALTLHHPNSDISRDAMKKVFEGLKCSTDEFAFEVHTSLAEFHLSRSYWAPSGKGKKGKNAKYHSPRTDGVSIDRLKAIELSEIAQSGTNGLFGQSDLRSLKAAEVHARCLWENRAWNVPKATTCEKILCKYRPFSFPLIIGVPMYVFMGVLYPNDTNQASTKMQAMFLASIFLTLMFHEELLKRFMSRTEAGKILFETEAGLVPEHKSEALLDFQANAFFEYAEEHRIIETLAFVIQERRNILGEHHPATASVTKVLGEEVFLALGDTKKLSPRATELVRNLVEDDKFTITKDTTGRALGTKFIELAMTSNEITLGRNHTETLACKDAIFDVTEMSVFSYKGIQDLCDEWDKLVDQLGSTHARVRLAEDRLRIAEDEWHNSRQCLKLLFAYLFFVAVIFIIATQAVRVRTMQLEDLGVLFGIGFVILAIRFLQASASQADMDLRL